MMLSAVTRVFCPRSHFVGGRSHALGGCSSQGSIASQTRRNLGEFKPYGKQSDVWNVYKNLYFCTTSSLCETSSFILSNKEGHLKYVTVEGGKGKTQRLLPPASPWTDRQILSVSHLSYNVSKVFLMSSLKHHLTEHLNKVAASSFVPVCGICYNRQVNKGVEFIIPVDP